MTNFKLGAAALSLDISGLATAWLNQDSDWTLFMVLLLHAGASLLLALFAWRVLPEKFRNPRLQVLALLFNFAFFIPILGLLGMLAAIFFSTYRRPVVVAQPFVTVSLPEFVLSLRETDTKYSQGGIKSRLAQPSIPTQQRLQALLALQGIPARVSSPMLHDMLGDASDDIRLVAYGLLDSREKKINAEIHRELVKLKTDKGRDIRLIGLRHLAELYWELVYNGLAQGDLRDHALRQALSYTNDALLLAPFDTGLWFLKGRILQEIKRYDDAYQIFGMAIANGFPESRVLPYIVEIAFDRRDYRTVSDLLSRISILQVTPIVKGAINFWVGRLKNSDLPLAEEGGA
jgi:tetratricopeptide (TPR) repeat protein